MNFFLPASPLRLHLFILVLENRCNMKTKGRFRQVQRSPTSQANVLVEHRFRFNAIGYQGHRAGLFKLFQELNDERIGNVLEDVLDEHQIGSRQIHTQDISAQKGYVGRRITTAIGLNNGRDHVHSCIVDSGPIDQPGKLPVPAPQVEHARDVMFVKKPLDELAVFPGVLFPRSHTGAAIPVILSVNSFKGVLDVIWFHGCFEMIVLRPEPDILGMQRVPRGLSCHNDSAFFKSSLDQLLHSSLVPYDRYQNLVVSLVLATSRGRGMVHTEQRRLPLPPPGDPREKKCGQVAENEAFRIRLIVPYLRHLFN